MSTTEAKPTWAALQEDPQLKERRDKIGKMLHGQIMDFQVNSPDKLASCVSKMLQMFDNVLQHPDDLKYRKVTSTPAAKTLQFSDPARSDRR